MENSKCHSFPIKSKSPTPNDYLDRPSYCGYDDETYKLKCIHNHPPLMSINSQEFQLLRLTQSVGLMKIQRLGFGENTCPEEILINNVFNYSHTAQNITLFYGCRNRGLAANHSFTCKKGGSERFAVFFKNDENECEGEKVKIPVGKTAFDELMGGIAVLNETLVQPFDMKYFAYDDYCRQCKLSGGRCGSSKDSPTTFACYCRDRPHQLKCHAGPGGMPVSYLHSPLTLTNLSESCS
ncbi:hypothetical protein REPUB_Repub08aG0103000 [Reevesia pubescens]